MLCSKVIHGMPPLLKKKRFWQTPTDVRLKPSVDLSFTALLYFGATLFIGVAAMNSQTNLLFGVFGLMVGVLLVAGYISRFSLRKLSVRRVMPDSLVVGESATLRYEIANGKRYWPTISVSLGEVDSCETFTRQPYCYLLHVAAGMSTTIAEELHPKRRGLCELDRYQLSTGFPFGFVKRAAVCHQKESIIVFPALAKVDRHVLAMCLSAEKFGARMRPRKGGDDEFYGIKEYREGENPRLIHWRLSARTNSLLCREMTQVAPPRLMILLDTHSAAGTPEEQTLVERAIAMAASLASFALEQGHPVGLIAWSGEFVHVPPNRGKRHRRELLTALSRLPTNSTSPLSELLDVAIPHIGAGSTAIVFTASSNSNHHVPSARRRMVIISATDAQSLQWFTFSQAVDFANCAPLNDPGESPAAANASTAPSTGTEVQHV